MEVSMQASNIYTGFAEVYITRGSRDVSFHLVMFFGKILPQKSSGSVAVTSSALVPGVFLAVTPAKFQVPMNLHLFLHHGDFSVLRHWIGSTVSISICALSPPVSGDQSSGASRSVDFAVSLVSVHTSLSAESIVQSFSSDIIPLISLGCSTVCSTTASMVIAHKVGRCAGKASLYTWNSFIPAEFSPALVDQQFHSVIALDLMAGFVMDSSSLLPGLFELIVSPGTNHDHDKIFGENSRLGLKSELMLIYGSLWRPPEISSVTSSWPISVELVCVWFKHSISRHPGSRTAYCGVAYKLWKVLEASFRHHNDSRPGEQWLANLTQNFECDVARRGSEICAADCYASLRFVSLFCDDGLLVMLHKALFKPFVSQGELLPSTPVCNILTFFSEATQLQRFKLALVEEFGLVICKYFSILLEFNLKLSQDNGGLPAAVSHYRQLIGKFIYLKVTRSSVGFASHNDTWISKQQAMVSRRSEEAECTSMVNATYELDWLSNLLHDLHIPWVDHVALFCDNQAAALHILNHFVSLELLLQQFFPEALLQWRRLYYGFLDHKLLALSGWFRFILDFLYCSLPRPPEEHLLSPQVHVEFSRP